MSSIGDLLASLGRDYTYIGIVYCSFIALLLFLLGKQLATTGQTLFSNTQTTSTATAQQQTSGDILMILAVFIVIISIILAILANKYRFFAQVEGVFFILAIISTIIGFFKNK